MRIHKLIFQEATKKGGPKRFMFFGGPPSLQSMSRNMFGFPLVKGKSSNVLTQDSALC
jgi:hypothetical protein